MDLPDNVKNATDKLILLIIVAYLSYVTDSMLALSSILVFGFLLNFCIWYYLNKKSWHE